MVRVRVLVAPQASFLALAGSSLIELLAGAHNSRATDCSAWHSASFLALAGSSLTELLAGAHNSRATDCSAWHSASFLALAGSSLTELLAGAHNSRATDCSAWHSASFLALAGSSLTELLAGAHNSRATDCSAWHSASFLALAGSSLTELLAGAHNSRATDCSAWHSASFLALAGSSLTELLAGAHNSRATDCSAWHSAAVNGSFSPDSIGQRIVVTGMAGAGKSTLSKQLAAATGLPLIHLDLYLWDPGWVRVSDDRFLAAQRDLLGADRWIADSNDVAEDLLLDRADTLIVLLTPWWLCGWRAFRRGLHRPRGVQLPEGCDESFRQRFADEWGIVRRNWRNRKTVPERDLALAARCQGQLQVHVLRSKREVRNFVNRL